uniref:Uncharacterized protein n=1 Tax=Rhizophora mucronata TaxID=61149 RepID=A0A2P2K533_RHIMU
MDNLSSRWVSFILGREYKTDSILVRALANMSNTSVWNKKH